MILKIEIAARPGIGNAEHDRDDQQHIETPTRGPRDHQQKPAIDWRQIDARHQSPGETRQDHDGEYCAKQYMNRSVVDAQGTVRKEIHGLTNGPQRRHQRGSDPMEGDRHRVMP